MAVPEMFWLRIEEFSGLIVPSFFPFSPPLSPLLTQCGKCLEDSVGTHGRVEGVASHMRVLYSLGAGWSHWRPWIFQAQIFHTA